MQVRDYLSLIYKIMGVVSYSFCEMRYFIRNVHSFVYNMLLLRCIRWFPCKQSVLMALQLLLEWCPSLESHLFVANVMSVISSDFLDNN